MKNLDNVLDLILSAKTIKGTSFVGVRNYTNAQGEVSNQTMIAGISYERVLLNDFNSLVENKVEIFKALANKFSAELIEKAYTELFVSLEKRLSSEEVKEVLRRENDATILRSDAQIDAYIHITKGVKLHKDTNQIHVFGLVAKKTVLVPIEYKQTNSRELTLCKNAIQKAANFRQAKYRTYIFNKAEVKLQGITI